MSKLKRSACSSLKTCRPSSHSGKAPASIASHKSRRWKSASAPAILTASSQSSECVPASGDQWNLQKTDSPSRVHEPEAVHAEALHHAVAARDRAVAHDPHLHVHRLGHQRHEIPERVVRARRLRHCMVRLGLHRMDDVGELHRVLDEEHRDVVADEVPVAFVGVELHREATHVAHRVGRAALAGDGGEAHEHRRALSRLGEWRGARDVAQRLVALEVAMRAGPSRVHDPLGYALVVEVRDLLAQDEVLHQRRAPQTLLQRVLVVADCRALVRRQLTPARVGAHPVERTDRRVDARLRLPVAQLV